MTGDAVLGDMLGQLQDEELSFAAHDEKQAAAAARSTTHSVDVERGLIGGLMLGGLDVIDDVEDIGLSGADFIDEKHGVVFDAILRLHGKRFPVDTLTVTEELNRIAQLEEVGGAVAIAKLEALIPTTAHCQSYAQLVADNARRRSLARLGRVVVRRSERGSHWREVCDYAESELMLLQRNTQSGSVVNLSDTVRRAVDALPAMGGTVQGELTGFSDLDAMLRLRPGEFTIIAGRPSMGKTALALDVFRWLTVHEQRPCAFFSLEMDAQSLVTRQIAAESKVPSTTKSVTQQQVTRITTAAGLIATAPQFIDETPGITVGEIRTRCRALHRKHRLAAVFVDYLSLVQLPGETSQQQKVSDISAALKNLARELSLPVICLSQLNRGVESRPNKRPVMSDLRDSGAIEQDADIICFLYRDEYYYGAKNNKAGIAEVIVAKHRNGPTDTVELHFNQSLPRFDNLSRSIP